MTRWLVTGANGFIGRHVVKTLLSAGDQVLALSRTLPPESAGNSESASGRLQRIAADVRDLDQLIAAMGQVDRVVHLAASVSTRSAKLSTSINVGGTRTIAAAASRLTHPPTLVYVSSLAAAGPIRHDQRPVEQQTVRESDACHPVSLYGRTKLEAETALREFAGRVPITIVRPPCVFGPRDRNLLSLYTAVKSGFNVMLSKTFRYSYISVTDLVPGIIAAAESGKRLVDHPADQGIYYLTDAHAVTFVELADMIAASLDEIGVARRHPLRHIRIPSTVGWLAGGCGEILMRGFGKRVFLNLDKVREGVSGSWVCDGSRAADELSFAPPADLATRLVETAIDYQQSAWL